MVTDDDIRAIALSLPETHERESYGGRPSFRTTARMFCWIRDDPEALVVWVASLDDKDAVIAADPAIYFTTDHYDGTPIVLVRLDTIAIDEATETIVESWRLRGPKRLIAQWPTDQEST